MAVEKKFVREAVHRLLIKEFLRKETERAGFGGIDIQRTPMGTRVSIVAERPGMVIGRKGSTINALTEELDRRFEVENPQIEVIEAGREADTNAQIMAQKLAEALERGWHFRRAGHSTVQRVIGSGAQGCQVIVSGKLTGQRHRTEKFSQGHIKYCGETADRVMDVGFAVAKKKLGVIGCTVRIMRAEHKLPDMITIKDVAPAPKPEAEEAIKADEPEAAETAKPKSKAKKAAKKSAAAVKAPEAPEEKEAKPEPKAKKVATKPPEAVAPEPEGQAEAAEPEAKAPPKKKEVPKTEKKSAEEPEVAGEEAETEEPAKESAKKEPKAEAEEPSEEPAKESAKKEAEAEKPAANAEGSEKEEASKEAEAEQESETAKAGES